MMDFYNNTYVLLFSWKPIYLPGPWINSYLLTHFAYSRNTLRKLCIWHLKFAENTYRLSELSNMYLQTYNFG